MALADIDAATPGAPARSRGVPLMAALAVIFGLSLVQRWLVMPNADVAWLLTVAERMLDGQRLYVDIVETNPPFSVWLYLPAALLARASGLRAEAIWDAMVFAGAGLALAATFAPLRRTALLDLPTMKAAAVATAMVALILPAACFGEREHVALLAFLPIVAHASLRAQNFDLTRAEGWASAFCIGLVLIIKPHFALALAAVVGLAALARADWRMLFARDHLFGAAAFAVYAGSTFLLQPAFWAQAMPLNAALYLPLRYSTLEFLRHFVALELCIVAVLGFSWIKCRNGIGHFSTLLSAGACGFFVAVVMQGKGMAYHFYPAFALALIVPFAAGAARTAGWDAHRLAAVVVAAYLWPWFNSGFDFRNAIQATRAAAQHPRVLALGSDFSIGPPVARAAGGTYVGRVACQWIADFASTLKAMTSDPDRREALDALARQDRRTFIEDLLTNKPDVLFIQRGPDDWMDWARRDPRFEGALADYRRVETVASGGMRNAFVLTYDMWTRRRDGP